MRGRAAKTISKMVYGEYSPRAEARTYNVVGNGMVVADRRRRVYQDAKKRYKLLNRKEK